MASAGTPQAQALADLGIRHSLRRHFTSYWRCHCLVAGQAQLAAKGGTLNHGGSGKPIDLVGVRDAFCTFWVGEPRFPPGVCEGFCHITRTEELEIYPPRLQGGFWA